MFREHRGIEQRRPPSDSYRTSRPSAAASGLCAGLAAGFVATLAMDGFHSLAKTVTQALSSSASSATGAPAADDEPSTAKLARRASRALLHRDLDDETARTAARAVHYAYGTLMGGLYGLAAALEPRVATGAGTLYGSALFLAGDEVAVPALGLAKPPTQYPPSTHLEALGSHLVYGTTLELVRRGMLPTAR